MAVTRLDIAFLQQRDARYIYLADASTYIETPVLPQLSVTVPGYSTVQSYVFAANSILKIDSALLGQSAENSPLIDLADGQYTFRYSIVPKERMYVEKSIFRIHKLEKKYADLLLSIHYDMSCNPDSCYKSGDLEKIQMLRLYMEGIVANADSCQFQAAIAMYQKAERMLDKLSRKGAARSCVNC